MTWQQAKWMAAGAALLLAVKYAIVGLNAWDAALHPGRIEPASLDMFKHPLLGALD